MKTLVRLGIPTNDTLWRRDLDNKIRLEEESLCISHVVLETSDKSVKGGEKNECMGVRKHKPEWRL